MDLSITKEFMVQETKKLLRSLFLLPELESILIKGVTVSSPADDDAIHRAMDESYHDMYSDVDIQINMELNQEEYGRNIPIYSDCLERIGFHGNILGMSHYCTEARGEVIRICKTNGMRFDLIITAACAAGIPMLLHAPISEEIKKANAFWFIAIQALGKLMRKDYLTASHLAHMLVQEGLVLQMVMRDKEKNTNFHRYGFAEELEYARVLDMEELPFAKTSDKTYNHIATLLYSAVKSYDRLFSVLNTAYESRTENYLEIWTCYCQKAD